MIVNHMVLRGHVTNQICYISTCTRTMDTKQGKVATYCEGLPPINQKKLKNTLWTLFMDGVQLPQGYSHFEEEVYFLPLSFQKFPDPHFTDLGGMKGWVDLGATQCF